MGSSSKGKLPSKGSAGKGSTSNKGSKPDGSHKSSSADPAHGGAGNVPAVSFLFVVSELDIDFDGMSTDRWFNATPPTSPEHYRGEVWGNCVFRYRDGVVTVAEGYYWVRAEHGYGLRSGSIWNASDPMEVYQQRTVLDCGPHLPRVVSAVDPSSQFVFDPDNIEGEDDDNGDEELPPSFWQGQFFALKFKYGHEGISRVHVRGASHVSGANPPWMPSLVPESFRAPTSVDRDSRGLSGDLGIVLGLMALSSPQHEPDSVFRLQHWHHHRWYGVGNQGFQPGPGECRGILVHIAFDDQCGVDNPTMYEWLRKMEDQDLLVRD